RLFTRAITPARLWAYHHAPQPRRTSHRRLARARALGPPLASPRAGARLPDRARLPLGDRRDADPARRDEGGRPGVRRLLALGADAELVVGLVAYLLAGRAALALPRGAARDWAFAIVNVAAVGVLCYATLAPHAGWFLCAYLALVVVEWALTRALAQRPGALPWVA